jgi:hypothetical protein
VADNLGLSSDSARTRLAPDVLLELAAEHDQKTLLTIL